MYIPSENAANTLILTLTGIPATVLALNLSQTDIALLALGCNMTLAIVFKIADVALRVYFARKNKE